MSITEYIDTNSARGPGYRTPVIDAIRAYRQAHPTCRSARAVLVADLAREYTIATDRRGQVWLLGIALPSPSLDGHG